MTTSPLSIVGALGDPPSTTVLTNPSGSIAAAEDIDRGAIDFLLTIDRVEENADTPTTKIDSAKNTRRKSCIIGAIVFVV